MKNLMVAILFVFVSLSSACKEEKTCPPEKVCPPPVVCAECPTCAVCPEPVVCPTCPKMDATGSIQYWIVERGKEPIYLQATATHAGGTWTFDMINSTGGPKDMTLLSSIWSPVVTPAGLLDKALKGARENHGQGTVNIDGAVVDFGGASGTLLTYVNQDSRTVSLTSASVVLVK